MPFGAGHWPFLLILLVIVLIIWGPGKLPELGSGMGKAIREFRKASTEVKDSFNQATAEPAPPAQPAAPVAPVAPAPAPTVQQQPVAPAAPVGNGEQQPSA
jgi:TatA/E family protein of Tat protein translocase